MSSVNLLLAPQVDLVEAVIIDELIISAMPESSIDAIRRVDPTAPSLLWQVKSIIQNADVNVSKETTAAHLKSAVANAKSLPSEQMRLMNPSI